MTLKLPNSSEECLYFTRRDLLPSGSAIAWVYKKDCPKCKKAKMGKPVEKGKVKIRADRYICPACSYTEGKKEHEDSASCEIIYTCPHCGKSGEITVPYKRKSFNGASAIVFECGSCMKKIGITKKLK